MPVKHYNLLDILFRILRSRANSAAIQPRSAASTNDCLALRVAPLRKGDAQIHSAVFLNRQQRVEKAHHSAAKLRASGRAAHLAFK